MGDQIKIEKDMHGWVVIHSIDGDRYGTLCKTEEEAKLCADEISRELSEMSRAFGRPLTSADVYAKIYGRPKPEKK